MQNFERLQYLTENTEKTLFNITKGFLSTEKFSELVSGINIIIRKICFTYSSESNFIRVINSIYDKVSFFNEALIYPHHLEYILKIVSNSNYLTDILVMNPEFIYLLFNNDFIDKEISYLNLKSELKDLTSRFSKYETKLRMVKSFHRKHILRIAARDIVNCNSLEKTTRELSVLANTVSEHLFDLIVDSTYKKHGLIRRKKRYTLISLGKLGGNELNYSSDLDFILIYDKNSYLGKNRRISLFEILNEATEKFIFDLSQPDDKGFLYRIDFRLRPDGKNSPLCRTFPDTIKYYEIRGEEWERQMLIKMNFTAGNKKLYNEFNNSLAHFIYPESFLESPLNLIARMKQNIELNTKEENNIKHDKGGLRDIEFLVQALQLINGGKDHSLRDSNTLSALKKLYSKKLFSGSEYHTLKEAYIFFRKIEHFLQLLNNKQTHTIPENEEVLLKLSYYLGYYSISDFEKKLNSYKLNVRYIFENFTGKDSSSIFESINFENYLRAKQNLEYLKRGKNILGEKQFDKRTISLFKEIESSLLNIIQQVPNKDFTVEQFVKFIRGQKHKSIYYKEFQDTNFLKATLLLCSGSAYVIDKISCNSFLSELYLTRFFFRYWDKNTLEQAHLSVVLISVSVKYILGIINIEESFKILAKAIDLKIGNYLKQHSIENDFVVCALGSYGIKELNPFSDLDLIIFTKKDNFDEPFLVEQIKNLLSPLEIDLRLRPEGNKGKLLISLNSFKKYLESRIRPWELLSYTKLRFVAGNINLYNNIVNSLSEKIDNFEKKKLKIELAKARTLFFSSKINYFDQLEIRKTKGGIKDIDFLIRINLITNFRLNDFIGRGNLDLIKNFTGLGKFNCVKRYKELLELDFLTKQYTNQNKSILTKDLENLIKHEKKSIIKFNYSNLKDLINKNKKEIEEEFKSYEKVN